MKVWVTRDKKDSHLNWLIVIWQEKPVWNGYSDGWVMEVKVTGFKALFGFTPRKGSCQQYNLTLTKI